MTVFKASNRKDYTASGSDTFAFDFKIYDETDLLVFIDGVLQTTGYTVSGGPIWTESGANVIFGTAPAVGSAIAIIRLLPLTQGTTWPEGGPFPSASHEAAADRLVMIAQQFNEAVGRMLKVGTTSLLTDIEVPEGGGKLIGWNAAGDAVVLYNQIVDTGVITTKGDLIVGGVGGAPDRKAIGNEGDLNRVAGGTVDWEPPTGFKLDDWGIPDDNTDLDVSVTKHGLCPKAPNDATLALMGTGTWGSPAVKGFFSNLLIKPATESGAGSRSLVITADSVVMENASGLCHEARAVNVTLDLSASGANGLDTGSIAVATWYFIWLIFNGTTVASLASLSSSAPTMPSGYTYKKLLGAVRNIGVISQLHMDGEDEGVVFTDQSGKTWTAHGHANTEQSNKQFGTASLELDGNDDDWIDTPDHADFTLGVQDFTIECWVKANVLVSGNVYRIGGQGTSGGAADYSFVINRDSDNKIRGQLSNGATEPYAQSGTLTDTASRHHIAFVRKGSLIKTFLDGIGGTPVACTITVQNLTANIGIGALGAIAGLHWNGFIDEFNFTVGLAKYWEDFTPPTAAFGNLCQILPFTQIDKDVQLGYPVKVGNDLDNGNTQSLSLASAIPTITRGIKGRILANGAGAIMISPTTFPSATPGDNNFTPYYFTFVGNLYGAPWEIPILLEAQTIYWQTTDVGSFDVWLFNYDLKGV